jgi:hypothetical protein
VNHALNVLEPRFPTVAAKLRAAENDVLAYLDFPVDHRRSISSTNAIERVNAELERRAKVVGIVPNIASLLRLFTAVLQDQHDEWQDGRRHFSQQSMARLLNPDGPPLLTNWLTGETLQTAAHPEGRPRIGRYSAGFEAVRRRRQVPVLGPGCPHAIQACRTVRNPSVQKHIRVPRVP